MKQLTAPALNRAITETFEPMPTVLPSRYAEEVFSYWRLSDDEKEWKPRHNFLEDIAAAWMLWEKMKEQPRKMCRALYNNLPREPEGRTSIDYSFWENIVLEISPVVIALAFYEFTTGETVEVVGGTDED